MKESGRFEVWFVDASVQLIKWWIRFVFRISPSASSEFRANQDVVITVVNLFLETTKENKMSVSRAIDEAIKNSSVITKYAGEY